MNSISVINSKNTQGLHKVAVESTKNTFCVLDLLNMLKKDTNYYLPDIKSYSRIGRKHIDTARLFNYSGSIQPEALIADLRYSKSRMNISIEFKLFGEVYLNKLQAKSVGLPYIFRSFIYNSHTIIKDGKLNISKFKVRLTDPTLMKLEQLNTEMFNCNGDSLISDRLGNNVVVLDLATIPVVNSGYLEKSNDVSHILKLVECETKLLAEQLVLNYYKKLCDVSENHEGLFMKYSDEQIEVLAQHGISANNQYIGQESNKQQETLDNFYMCKSIVFCLKGISKLPKVIDVLERMGTDTKLPVNMELVASVITDLSGQGISFATLNSDSVYDLIILNLKRIRLKLIELRAELTTIKIATVLTDSWLSNLSADVKGNLYYTDANGLTLVIKRCSEQIYF